MADDSLFDTDPFDDSLLLDLDCQLEKYDRLVAMPTSAASPPAARQQPASGENVSPVLYRKLRRGPLRFGSSAPRTVDSTQSTENTPPASAPSGCVPLATVASLGAGGDGAADASAAPISSSVQSQLSADCGRAKRGRKMPLHERNLRSHTAAAAICWQPGELSESQLFQSTAEGTVSELQQACQPNNPGTPITATPAPSTSAPPAARPCQLTQPDSPSDLMMTSQLRECLGTGATPARSLSTSQLQRRALLHRLRSPATATATGDSSDRLAPSQMRPPASSAAAAAPAVGPFYGLPASVATLLEKQRGIKCLYEWQRECLSLEAVRCGRNLVYSLPTSGGKTLVAELLLLRQLVCRQRDCLLVVPYVAIVQEKVRSLAPFGLALGFIVAEYAGERGQYPPPVRRKRRTVYVCTIEKAVGIVCSLQQEGRAAELGLAVIDELHMLGDGGRGASLELLIIFLKSVQAGIQLVGMSATIGNMAEVCRLMEADMFCRQFRPVQLRECVLLNGQLLEVTPTLTTGGGGGDLPPDQLLTPLRQIRFSQYSEQQRRADPDGVGGLVSEIVPANSCLVFCATKHNCLAVAQLICRALDKSLMKHAIENKKSLYRALQEESGGDVCSVLRKTLPYGVAYHHSGLTGDERRLLEEAYVEGTLCCLCCTSTLAAGVNLPAKRVIIRSPYTGASFLTRARYKQMAGRAGRAGIDATGESILIIKDSDAKKVGQLLTSPVERCCSQLLEEGRHGLKRLVVSSVALQLSSTRHQLRQLLNTSLLALQQQQQQQQQADCVVERALTDVIVELRRDKLLRVLPITDGDEHTDSSGGAGGGGGQSDNTANTKRQQLLQLGEEEDTVGGQLVAGEGNYRLKVSRLALAAIKGSVDLSHVSQLYSDLHAALGSLALQNQLHLLYLVTPYSMLSQLPPPLPDVYLDMYSCLDESELDVARRLGVCESTLVKLMSGKSPSPTCHRFYLALILYSLLRSNRPGAGGVANGNRGVASSGGVGGATDASCQNGGSALFRVARRFQLHRGQLQQLVSATAAFAAGVLHFCRQLDELWPLAQLLEVFNKQLAVGCTVELLELMELPAVKHGRARGLYAAGFTSLQLLANAEPEQLVQRLHHMTRRVAVQIVDSAKMLVLEKAEKLQEEAEFLLDGLKTVEFHESPGLSELILTGINDH